jgi:ribonuclease BN (tRNA processing enzyme)
MDHRAYREKGGKMTEKTVVTILGSGTCVPSLARSSCAVLVETAGSRLLFDIGPGTTRRMLEAETEIFDVSHLFLSHFHPDHSGELVSFIFSNKYPDEARRKIPLVLTGGPGLTAFFGGLKTVYGVWLDLPPERFTLNEIAPGGGAGAFDRFRIETASMLHRKESLAYRVTDQNGYAVVYSGDTDYTDALVALSRGADLLVCESSLPDAMKAEGHLTPSLAGEIAARANVGRLILTHFYPECDKADIRKECRKAYSGPLLLAEDLMRIEIGGDSEEIRPEEMK